MVRRRPYRVIYNADTSWAMQNSRDVDDYVNGMVGFIDEESGVDALFWHDGSGGNNAYYDSEVMELNGERIGKVEPLLRRMIDDGDDPPAVTIAAAREKGVDVFYSFRINDCHDSIGDGRAHPQLLATFKLEHPEWLIGPGHPYGGCNQLNFAIPEVLDLKFAILEEAARKYDFDGFEIDFQRSAPFFIPGTEPDNAPILTGFLRRVRDHFAARGAEHGRPIALAVRVCESLEACRLNGFDVATWIDEGLVDIVVSGTGAVDIEVEAFRQLAAETDVLIYPCLYGWPSGYGPFTSEMCRGLAANYWRQGADGIYTFNWNAHTYTQRAEEEPHGKFAHQLELLRQIDHPAKLAGTDKEFPADRKPGSIWYPHNWSHCVLPVRIEAGEAVDVPVFAGEEAGKRNPAPRQLQLRLCVLEADAELQLDISLNGVPLRGQSCDGGVVTLAFEQRTLREGRNEVRLTAGTGSCVVDKAWIDISY